jgi:hypothetical protein
MATIKLQGSASGGGSVTLTAPNTNSARTITLPDQDVDFGSLGGAGSIQAWISMNGQGTVAIRNDGNISSLLDNGVGDYTANFSNTLSTSNHGMSGSIATYTASDPGASDVHLHSSSGAFGANPVLSTSSVRVEVGGSGGANYDYGYVSWGVIT